MKSIGLSVVLAQAGFYVPAVELHFGLYDKLFTRIVSKDNLYKGLSTFIFNRADERSLILGDEISQGTETLGIKYDEANDALIYNRVLQLGRGDSLYGLEFAKSLHMDKEFLQTAQTIRENLNRSASRIKTLSRQKRSKYHKELYLSKCALCDKGVDDVHHIAEQKEADRDGYIDHFHKNHKYNLIPLCKKHHQMVHDGRIVISGFMMTSEGLKLHYEVKEQ